MSQSSLCCSVHAGQIIVCPNLQLRAFDTDQLHAWQQQLDSFTQQLVSAGASCDQQVLQYLQGQANAKLVRIAVATLPLRHLGVVDRSPVISILLAVACHASLFQPAPKVM